MSDVLPSEEQLDDLIRAVPGVDELYSSAPLVAAVIATAVDAVTGRSPSAGSVEIAQGKSGLSVSVKIGIVESFAATDVCRRVHDAIAEQLDRSGTGPVDAITVTVARIG
ncbi:hypothetical protein E3T26_09380 [Cryobacterium sp. TMT1-21]|uniref:Uncharacterized protein n=1 Tax=Cryobacterium shii TaxID=1259235 RepID=A0AAQ2C674_9MICO|nr:MULTISPECIES: hypothetical protein [Cryobacterium]TFC47113.1 hypothetical protein E3O49_09005 [Cryobacterium shii]TFC85420.1 hypothetical protein E3T24_08345 [Cryobacterium sp. TmT2-59]TFD13098.1 hypothetical protein E3T42_14505 [Cryobacterium sp. TMT4-10]TFD13808.1 hypothetical protein E3T26_09380 [Cryobacterium sp. TMT1-21]TFD16961.1 hypothetical protein E3T32_14420 [Cryobacterium sp. TMT2-23]